jgi:hypothetical protein
MIRQHEYELDQTRDHLETLTGYPTTDEQEQSLLWNAVDSIDRALEYSRATRNAETAK